MKATKRALLALALASGLAAPSLLAQPPEGGRPGPGGPRAEMRIEDRLKQLGEALALTDEQKTAIKPILEESGAEMRKLLEDRSGDREARRSKLMELREKTNTKIAALLTDEQKAKFAELNKRGPGGPRGERPERRRGGE
jgi:P pilus assembly/Cpx signaling pathway, periplasmic inhibitor/zinc-resistance associated protein